MAEMLRIIREEEPPKPSTRLSESKGSLSSISAQRQIEPGKLTKLVRGELDWIVMKARWRRTATGGMRRRMGWRGILNGICIAKRSRPRRQRDGVSAQEGLSQASGGSDHGSGICGALGYEDGR